MLFVAAKINGVGIQYMSSMCFDNAGKASITSQAAKQLQLDHLTEAESVCQTAMRQAAGLQADAGLTAELRRLSDNFAGLRKLVESQQVILGDSMYRLQTK